MAWRLAGKGDYLRVCSLGTRRAMQRAWQIAVVLSGGEADQDTSVRVQLLVDMKAIFDADDRDQLPSAFICANPCRALSATASRSGVPKGSSVFPPGP